MAPAPDRIAILLPVGVAVTMTFSTVIIQVLALMGIIHFVRYELRLRRAGVQFWRGVGIIAGAALVALAAHVVAIATWGVVFSLFGFQLVSHSSVPLGVCPKFRRPFPVVHRLKEL